MIYSDYWDLLNIDLRRDSTKIIKAGDKYDVVAFFQNTWFIRGTETDVIIRYTKDQEYQQKLIAQTMTGRRLLSAFTSSFRNIFWDNCTQLSIDDPNGSFDANREHVLEIIARIKPKIVIGFGAESRLVIQELLPLLYRTGVKKVLFFKHPNARGVTSIELREFAMDVIETWKELK